MKTFITRSGKHKFTEQELETQLKEAEMYSQADNALGWMVRKLIMNRSAFDAPQAIEQAAKLFRSAETVFDVRY